jgi:hypothetical protein
MIAEPDLLGDLLRHAHRGDRFGDEARLPKAILTG